jgi:hypothetical protein
VRQGLSDVHTKFKENQQLVAACEQAGTKVNEIMKSEDAQAITGHLSKLMSTINSSEKYVTLRLIWILIAIECCGECCGPRYQH